MGNQIADARFSIKDAEFMKSMPPNSLPAYISIVFVFVLCASILVGNAIYVYGDLPLSIRSVDGGQRTIMVGLAVNAIALAVLVLFYCLTKYHFHKRLKAENELRRVNGSMHDLTARITQLSGLSRHLMQVTEKEKTKIAHELHTEFGARVSVAVLDISVVAAKLRDAEIGLASRLEHAQTVLKEMIDLKRQIVADLRPSMLDSLGLSFTLAEYVKNFAKANGLALHAEICESFDQIDPDCAIALFRIVEEIMINVVKHAGANSIWIALRSTNGGLSLLLADDGKGIALDALWKPKSHGLAGMRERSMMLGGTLTVRRAASGHGTEIEIRVPLPQGTER